MYPLHAEILAELEYEPELHPERIGVSVEDGVVTIYGHVDSYSQKLAAERVVKRVYSAKAIVDQLEVELPSRDEVPDDELAHAALRAVGELDTIPPDSIRVTVRNAHLALEGVVDWYCQRDAAEAAVRPLRGARGVTNHIRVREELPPEGITEFVESPLLSV